MTITTVYTNDLTDPLTGDGLGRVVTSAERVADVTFTRTAIRR